MEGKLGVEFVVEVVWRRGFLGAFSFFGAKKTQKFKTQKISPTLANRSDPESTLAEPTSETPRPAASGLHEPRNPNPHLN